MLVSIFGSFAVSCVQPEHDAIAVKWQEVNHVGEQATSERRPIFGLFYADWCEYCEETFQTTLQDPVISQYLNTHFVCFKLNVESPDQIVFDQDTLELDTLSNGRVRHEFAARLATYQAKVEVPTIVFLDQQLLRIHVPIQGFVSADQLLKHLKYVTDSTAVNVPFELYQPSN